MHPAIGLMAGYAAEPLTTLALHDWRFNVAIKSFNWLTMNGQTFPLDRR